ncbi:MAG: hypothetical protein M3461_15455 [Pseudomonadota bacterium]|nr:hypothetical protein [Pseudomonadota bacterium]
MPFREPIALIALSKPHEADRSLQGLDTDRLTSDAIHSGGLEVTGQAGGARELPFSSAYYLVGWAGGEWAVRARLG